MPVRVDGIGGGAFSADRERQAAFWKRVACRNLHDGGHYGRPFPRAC